MSAREGTGGATRTKARQDDASPFSRLQARGEQLLDSLSELGRTILPEGEQSLDALLGQIDKVRDAVSRRAHETGRGLEARADQVLGDLEREAVRRLGPVLTRANVLSRADVAPLESRIAHLESRLGGLLDDRAALTSRVVELERNLEEARAIASEREREATMALSTGDNLHQALAEVRTHLDALSKDQVSRGLESGKIEDRLVRLEMRLGEVLKEQGTRSSERESVEDRLTRVDQALDTCEARLGDIRAEQGSRASEKDEIEAHLARVNQTMEESARTLANAAQEATAAIAATRELGAHIETMRDERTADRGELFQIAHRIGDVERLLRQCDLRLGDLTERHTAGREELASLAARVSQLELTAARPTPPAAAARGQAEGH